MRDLCNRKGIIIHEAEACPDHIHMLISIPPKYSVSEVMGYLKGKSSLIIFDRHANLKYKYGSRHFWCRGYFVDTVGKNAKKIEQYIKNQLFYLISNDLKLMELPVRKLTDILSLRVFKENGKGPFQPQSSRRAIGKGPLLN